MTTESRLEQVESELADVTARLHRLEVGTGMGAPRTMSRRVESPSPELRWPAPPVARRERTAFDFEAVFGGQILAWIGGLAILFGAVLFLGMAISRGWLDEETRTIIAAAIALAALLGGIWLHERRGHTEAARALVASAISGLFGTIVVATQAYSLISPELGLALGAAVAAIGFGIAVRWRSPIVAAVGSLGALTAPPLVGVDPSGLSIAFVAMALAATVGILVWQRWDWLALGAFLVSAPQLGVWVAHEDDHLVLAIAVLFGFWLLYAGAALGYELRKRVEDELPIASWLLLLGGCVTFVGLGYGVLEQTDHHTAAVVLLFAFSGLQVGMGVLAIRLRIHRELGALLVGLGIALSAFGLGAAFHGPALVVAWAAAAAALAGLGSRLDATPSATLSSAERMIVAAVCFLILAIGHTVFFEAPPKAIFDGVPDLAEAAIALAACAAGAFAVARFARRVTPEAAQLAAFAGATLLVYLGSIAIVDTVGVDAGGDTRQAGQTWLSAFWTATGLGALLLVGAFAYARIKPERDEEATR